MSNITVVIILILFAIDRVWHHQPYNTVMPIIAVIILVFFYFALKLSLALAAHKADVYQMILISLGLSSVVFLIFIGYTENQKVFCWCLIFLFGFIGFTFTVDYVFHNILKPHQQTRMNILLGKETDIRDVGYNLNQSKIAIGSGGFAARDI